MFHFFASYSFSVFTISIIASKLARLAAYVDTLPLAPFILYSPTFWVFDVLAICIARFLFWPQSQGVLAAVAFTFGLLLTIFTAFGASSNLGFYFRTSTELDWADAAAFVTNKNAVVVLLSGSWRVGAAAGVILAVALLPRNCIYRSVGALNYSIGLRLYSLLQWLLTTARSIVNSGRTIGQDLETEGFLAKEVDISRQSSLDDPKHLIGESQWVEEKDARPRSRFVPALRPALRASALAFLIIAFIIRPSRPYAHLSATLPMSFIDALHPKPNYCEEQRLIMNNEWPLPELLESSRWKRPDGSFKGWAPEPRSELGDRYRQWTPTWMFNLTEVPRGFERWELPSLKEARGQASSHASRERSRCPQVNWREAAYNPVEDPLRITNLDHEILEPLKEAMDNNSIKIKHVVYILMESLRPELFPLQQGSNMHQEILDLSPEEDQSTINERLSHLTPHIERITGVSGGFEDERGRPYSADDLIWEGGNDDRLGGINVIGAFTTATMSTKSFAANHCGAWPMPVDTFDEAETDSYQPCMPQILNFWSSLKGEGVPTSDDFRDQKWAPALFESMVEAYDRQEIFDQKIGFQHVMTREGLERAPDFDKKDPRFQKVNYFGYAEQVLKPHIKEYITETIAKKERIWMSHFTSSTHHAWGTPEWFNTTDYVPSGFASSGHRDMGRFLNTIRFHDAWMGELLQLFEDLGMANETLIVFAGDHGMAFTEDDAHGGTYNNPHVSNLRVPITFRHPHLPRVQYHANATTISTLPTILDLLIHSGSLNDQDTAIATDLVHEYEGQSLIRPYKASEDGRRSWNFAVLNPGGKMLAVTSADAPWLLIIPFGDVFPYRFADLSNDPMELDPAVSWTMSDMLQLIENRFGADAASWAGEAEEVGRWWSADRKRLWKHHRRA